MGLFRTLRLAACVAGFFLVPAPVAAQNFANGERIYHMYCVLCHGFPPLGGPETAAYNPVMIRNAIEARVARMRFMSFLTDSDLADVATYVGRTIGVAARPERNYTDMWWTESESGWGLSLVQHREPRDTLFGVLFTYDSARRPLWLVMPGGEWIAPANYEGDLFQTSGPHFALAFEPATVTLRKVGRMAVAFEGEAAATVVYTVDGIRIEKRITRQPF